MSEWLESEHSASDELRRRLVAVLFQAVLEIRAEAWGRGSDQPLRRIAAFADLVHHLPLQLESSDPARLREAERALRERAAGLGLTEWLAARLDVPAEHPARP